MTSSPLRPGASLQEERDYWKSQFEQLQTDLADFQSASKDIEEQLEKDIEAAERSERKLKEQVESLNFQVDEWRGKHKQAKAEANSAQNALQREITGMREQNRSLSYRLRDIEVANDDYEMQARHTTSSLEDLEGKLNMSIERGVLLEEEVKVGEQEREGLRIEAQRLRDELGDLKVESEITLEKLKLAEGTIESLRTRKPSNLAVENLRGRSPASTVSGITPSSPTASTPPPRSDSASDAPTPPSPPLSDTPAYANKDSNPKTAKLRKRTSLIPDSGITPRPSLHGPRAAPSRHTRGQSMASSTSVATSDARPMKPPPRTRPSTRPSLQSSDVLPRSESLLQMKNLRSRMQKIEERVQTARSRLPPPSNTTPRGSPRAGSVLGNQNIPASVTVRRTSKRPSSIATPFAVPETPAEEAPRSPSRREPHIKRLSYGIPRPSSSSSAAHERPPSTVGSHRERPPSSHGMHRPPSSSGMDRPPSAAGTTHSRPSSRVSLARPESRTDGRTPLGHRPSSSITGIGGAGTASSGASMGRPKSSVGGSYASQHSVNANGSSVVGTPTSRSLHRASASVSGLRRKAAESEDSALSSNAAGRRTTMERGGMPAPIAGTKRQSIGMGIPMLSGKASGRRTSVQVDAGEMRPPPSRRKAEEVNVMDEDELGETY